MRRTDLCGVAAVCIALLATQRSPTIAADTDRARRLDEQREDAAVRQAQQAVDEAQRDVRESLQSLQKSQAAFRQAEAERKGAGVALQKTIDRLEEEHAASAGLVAARSHLKQSRAAFDQASEPILASVKTQAAYQAAEVELAEATALLTPEAEGDREEAARRAAAARAAMRDLERAAIASDSRIAPFEKRVTAAETNLDAAQSRFEKAVESDADLKAARKAFQTAQAAEAKAEAALLRDNRDLLSARSKLARAQQSLTAKKLDDQRDSNQPPKKSKAR